MTADPTQQMERIPLEGEIPNPANPPTGCYFHTRCRYCKQQCKETAPEYKELEPGHFEACGISPSRGMRSICWVGSATGTADSRLSV
mgnify:CR=1 FL=1